MTALPLEDVARSYCASHNLTFTRSIGAGAFKETFAVVLPGGTAAALKVYKPGFNAQRVVREVDALIKCRGKNIAELFSIELFDLSGIQYLASTEELLTGGTLTEKLASRLLSPAEALLIGSALIEAVSTIAANRLVHRDIKPDNIMFRADGESPVLVDFGLVRDLGAESITQTWQLRGPGTPLYAPPEQLRNDKAMIDWRSDQFSLGVVLSYATFGVHPYDRGGDSVETIVERVATRGSPEEPFLAAANRERLLCLTLMVQPWPINRIHTPATLLAEWNKQLGH